VVVEDINKLPLFLAGMTDLPFCAIVPHLFGETAFQETSWPAAAVVWAAERPLPWRPVAVYAAVVLPWVVFAVLYFGSPVPVLSFQSVAVT